MRSLCHTVVFTALLSACATANDGEVVTVTDASTDSAADVSDDSSPDVQTDGSLPLDQPTVTDVSVTVDRSPVEASVSCGEFKSRCGTDCVDTLVSNDHCGSCNTPCRAAVGEVARCMAGMCTTHCAENFGDCDGDSLTGCETNLIDSVLHCGACEHHCNVLTGGTTRCEQGRCIEQCPGTQSVCGSLCVNLSADRTHCGTCDRVCAMGETCMNGRCLGPSGYRVSRDDPAAVWIDACSLPGHVNVLTNTDGGAFRTSLPFAFHYWGMGIPSGAPVVVTPDGYVSFDTDGATPANGIIPNRLDGINAVLAVQWRDLRTRGNGVCIGTTGPEGARAWVVQWSDARYFTSSLGHLNFEIVLHEHTDTIDFVYASQYLAEPATVALEDWDGARSAVPFDIPQPIVFSNRRVRFIPE